VIRGKRESISLPAPPRHTSLNGYYDTIALLHYPGMPYPRLFPRRTRLIGYCPTFPLSHCFGGAIGEDG